LTQNRRQEGHHSATRRQTSSGGHELWNFRSKPTALLAQGKLGPIIGGQLGLLRRNIALLLHAWKPHPSKETSAGWACHASGGWPCSATEVNLNNDRTRHQLRSRSGIPPESPVLMGKSVACHCLLKPNYLLVTVADSP
jgi:hypothetical protein